MGRTAILAHTQPPPRSALAHLFCLEPASDPLVLDAGDGVQEAAAGELQALVEAAVGQPLPAADRNPQLPASAGLNTDSVLPLLRGLWWSPTHQRG